MAQEAFYLGAPRPRGRTSFYLGSPKEMYLGSPHQIYMGSPRLHDPYSVKVWRERLEAKIKSPDAYAGKFLRDVDELTKRFETYKPKFEERVKERRARIWGRE